MLYKTLIGAKPLRIRFDKVNEFIRIYDGTRCLVLFGHEKYNFIYNMIRQSVSGRNKCMYCSSHVPCYGSVQSCAIHNSFASYDGDVICACRTNKIDCQ